MTSARAFCAHQVPTIPPNRFRLRSVRALPARRRYELAETDLSPELLAQLTPEQRAWWVKFLAEYHGAEVKKGDRSALHRADHLRKDCYTRQNKANFDLLNLAAVSGTLDSLDAPLDQPGGATLGDVTPSPVLADLEALSSDQLVELAASLPEDAPEPQPLFGGEVVFLWAQAHGLEPGPRRSVPTAALRASLQRFCRKRGWRYPFGADPQNNRLGRALKSLGLHGFEQGVREPGKPRRWVRVYSVAEDADPSLLDPRFTAGAVVARGARHRLRAGRRSSTPSQEMPVSKPKPAEKKLEPLPPSAAAPEHPECLPVVKSLGVVERGSRLVVVYLETQGDQVVGRKVLSPCPELPAVAHGTFKAAVVRHLRLF